MNRRPASWRSTIPIARRAPLLALLLVPLVASLLAACATRGPGPGASSDSLPTGLVGPVAPTVGPQALRYIALGDSYTFGDGVRQRDRWSNQLVRILRPELDLDLIANLSSRNTASRDLIEDQLPDLPDLGPQFVSVQVGANDVVFDTPPDAYEANMRLILDTILEHVAPDRVVVLTTPDFTLTEAGGASDVAEAQAERIALLNTLLKAVASDRGVAVVDVAPIADRVTFDPSLVGPDGIHPSAKQYAGWADLVATTVRGLFRSSESTGPPGSVQTLPTVPPAPAGLPSSSPSSSPGLARPSAAPSSVVSTS